MQYYGQDYDATKPKVDLPRRRIASTLAEFSSDAFSESAYENSFNDFDSSLKVGEASPRFNMKPAHILALILFLVAVLCASLTMLISQSLTYNSLRNEQSESLRISKNNSEDNSKNSEDSFDKSEESDSNGNAEHTNEHNTASSNDNSETGSENSGNSSEENNNATKENYHGNSEKTSAVDNAARNNAARNNAVPAQSSRSGINLNTATANQLQTLKGIGPKTAARIIAHRKRIGRFSSLEDLLQIKGIGPKTLNKFRGNVYVG